MIAIVAWRMLTHEKGRSALAVGGIFVAVLMIFLELGFYFSVPAGGMLVYDRMNFDLMLTSSDYVYQDQPYDFPRRRLFQASALSAVASVAPVYQGETPWLNEKDGIRRNVFVMGFDLDQRVFNAPTINRALDALKRPDTVLVDSLTRPMFGPLGAGTHVEINNRDIEIAGDYVLGTGFTGLGAVVTSDLNFIRIFPDRTLETVNLGLIRLKPGNDPDTVAAELRAILPADTRVFTHDELARQEIAHWVTITSTGLVFGFGVIISMIVGTVILYQTLSTQITRQLPQYATLKAIGYTDGRIGSIVAALAMIIAFVAYVPALAVSVVVYAIVRGKTMLPISMTDGRVVTVLVVTVMMSAASAFISLRGVRRADPVDLL